MQKGFTIIELIVVIAIIAVLASIVLSNVTVYISKSKDAAIREDVSNVMPYTATYYINNNSSYAGFCTDPQITTLITKINSLANPNTATCSTSADSSAWCMSIILTQPLQGGVSGGTSDYYCIDSVGSKKDSSSQNCSSGACI